MPHRRLLGKLSHYGINGPILRWIGAFLEDREQGVVVEGRRSPSARVLSGVPQGTVLGPLLFLIHINDLPSVVHSQVRLFADDCLMYRPIYSVDDQSALQRDLSSLERWGDTWGMKFNAKKCQIITLARGRRPFIHFYTLCNHILESVSDAKYLGILVSNDLSWSPHINSVFNRANSTLGVLQRYLRRCPAPLKETAYITLVRSTMEYAAPIWDPHLSKDSHMLENIQRRALVLSKGILELLQVLLRCCRIWAWKTLRTATGTSGWRYCSKSYKAMLECLLRILDLNRQMDGPVRIINTNLEPEEQERTLINTLLHPGPLVNGTDCQPVL